MSEPFDKAVAAVDTANAADPRREDIAGNKVPQELLYSQRMTEMLQRFFPEADEVQQLAVRGHHIERWTSPRDAFPMTREGYLKWRKALYGFHAQRMAGILADAGYDECAQERVRTAVGKKQIKQNPDSQLVEDIAGLVFVEHYLEDFASKHSDYDEEKWLGILIKTLKKMSAEGRDFALAGKIQVPAALVPLLQKAVCRMAESRR